MTLAAAIAAYLAEHPLSPASQRIYAGALRALQDHLGTDTSLAVLNEARSVKQIASWFRRATGRGHPPYGSGSSPSCVFACAFWRQRAWLATDPTADLERPKVPLDRTRALTHEQIVSLWRRDGVALREGALWTLLYETAARAPTRSCRSTSRTSIYLTSGLASGAKVGQSSGCSGKPVQRCSCRGYWPVARAARCF
jgi:site-specific recombinase XerC